MLRWDSYGAQHSWCASVHTELKSIEPISICAEYISFVLLFSQLKWSLISDNWFFIEERDSVCRALFYLCVYLFTCIVAQPLPFFPPPVQPGAEAHQDDPACPSQTSDEGRLLHHVRDAVVALWARHYVRQLCTWGWRARQEKNKEEQTVRARFIYSSPGWKCNDSENLSIYKIYFIFLVVKTCLK